MQHHSDLLKELGGQVRLLCLNAFIRPPGIHSGVSFSQGDFKSLRLDHLKQKIRAYDIVLLQEMFELGGRQGMLINDARAHGLPYHAGPVRPQWASKQLIDSGLLVLSRYPILETDFHRFSKTAGIDGISSKAVLYAKIQILPTANGAIHVFTVHTQSGEDAEASAIRLHQLEEMAAFVKRKVRDDVEAPVVIGGDFNLDARHDYLFEEVGKRPRNVPCKESQDYAYTEDLLRTACASHQLVNVMKLHADVGHPVTNGIGHGILHYIEDQEHTDVAKCIDYVFLANPTSKSTMRLDVVEGSCKVDVCDVLLGTPAAPVPPVSKLSDHAGISTVFSISMRQKVMLDLGTASSYSEWCVKTFPPPSYWHIHCFTQNPKVAFVLLTLPCLVLCLCRLLCYITFKY